VRRRRDAKQAQKDEDYRLQYHEEAVARIVERHSQRQQSPPPSPALSMPQPSSSSDSDSETGEPRRPRRGVPRTQKLVDNSQTEREMAAARSKLMKRQLGEEGFSGSSSGDVASADAYVPPPSSAVLLDNDLSLVRLKAPHWTVLRPKRQG
jgi:hypothetical protein